ncbi:MAG: peptidase C39 [Flavobacteriaceae bacterium CG_4_10_14_3_um_filter_31_253]|nr:MAG: peptidase C39 [Flavobacteriaceae bacterium CG17_big_fil_post_rev_8_21_14_2_50_31_13]PIX12348.1 MAG: peptidase C39 [Flavobacteriaceae bacterium CG_4_8_14_3_um_filter_31_8]PIY13853.1 MAG: peptidase C39 [Flavobacteriaceae bacterium CG_4_10_14_3_um_filter_31_253]PIZ09561.1 MAG: peptidase C39 [Flavobacteriaceae bacterium CG_4_10_14_0_8_um_filter_31_99]PJC10105.1 MAG: peptidase C39 [Flavobacteriaceae bacterium CG_4_9_14_0_8_um_filter_31_91]
MTKAIKLSQKHLQQTFTQQHDQSDCGVACLLSLIQFYGGSNSLEKLRELSGTTKQGTTLLGLYQAANKLGFTAQGNEADIQAVIDHKELLILHVVIQERLQHYLVCYGYEKDKFIIGDPAKGIATYTKEQLNTIWKSKTCLTLSPNSDFIKTETQNKNKKQWFLKLLKEDYRLISFSVLLGLGIAILGMAMAIFSQKLIDDILPSKDFNKLITGIALVAFLLLVRVLFTALRDFFLIRQTKDFNNRIVDSFYSSLLNLPKPFFDTRKIGELVARLNDTQRVQRVISQIVGNVVINALVTTVSLGFLFYYSWQTGVIASISLPFYFVLIYSFNKRIINAQKEVMQGYAFSESNYITSMQGIATIKNNNRQTIFQKINQLIYGNFQEKAFNLGKINVRLSVFSGVFSVLFLMGILAYTSILVYNETMQLGELMAILGIAGSLLPSVASLALITIPINEAKVAFNRMYEFASMDKEQKGTTEISDFTSLDIKNLTFRFAGRSQLLKDINIKVNKNECIAIVGESGSGKSTLGQILQKFYTFENGTIIVNNETNLTVLNTENWRTILGVVPQEVTIFGGNVIINILLGQEDTPENIVKFCKDYGFETFINTLPQSYATILGEEGINLSGGQKQVIALMRALYKKPKVLLLDEFTSAMDRKTEHFVLDLLNKLKSELTIIFISHRIHSLPKIADRIYILENGIIADFGNHEKLMESKNFYSEFWTELHTE